MSEHIQSLSYLVRAMMKFNASDMHLRAQRPPVYRINGLLIPARLEALSESAIAELFDSFISERVREKLKRDKQVDFSFEVAELGRFRCNLFFQKSSLSAVIRRILPAIPSIEELGIPAVLKDLSHRPRGLILISGPSGSGKSTTLNALIHHINETRAVHVLTFEDPIEFIHKDQKSTITQREIGTDTHSFEDAFRAGLRQDPDVVVVGEMRDAESMRWAITTAETGRLVLSTIHTAGARETIERIVTTFPGLQREQLRVQLSGILVGIVTQELVMRADGKGRALASEVLVNSPQVQSLIMNNDLEKLTPAISESNAYYGMHTLNQDLKRLVKSGVITLQEALRVSPSGNDLKLLLEGLDHQSGLDEAA